MLKYILLLFISLPIQAAEVSLPIHVVITTPFHELSYTEALLQCQNYQDQYCKDIVDIDGNELIEVLDGDMISVFEVLDDEGLLANE